MKLIEDFGDLPLLQQQWSEDYDELLAARIEINGECKQQQHETGQYTRTTTLSSDNMIALRNEVDLELWLLTTWPMPVSYSHFLVFLGDLSLLQQPFAVNPWQQMIIYATKRPNIAFIGYWESQEYSKKSSWKNISYDIPWLVQ